MEKIDLRRQLKQFYAPSARVVAEVQVPAFTIGPFSEEGPAIERLHAHIEARTGLRGKHHEIYLTDIRRADPSRWKTVIRQPMG